MEYLMTEETSELEVKWEENIHRDKKEYEI